MKKLTTTTTAAPAPLPEPWRPAGHIPAHLERYAGPMALLVAVVERARLDARRSVEARRFVETLREAA